MEEYTFGGSRFKAVLGSLLSWVAEVIKWWATSSITRLNKVSKWFSGEGAQLLLNAEQNVISEVKISLLNRHLKQYRFKCNGKKRVCYEEGDYINVYKKKQQEELVVTESDFYYIRFNGNWRKD